MSRRAPPRDYDEEDEFYEMERERERDRRPRRRDRHYEEDVEYRRRSSEPPVEGMEHMHIRERPRRDFMEERFAPPPRARNDNAYMRSRKEVDMVSPERYMPLDRDDAYMRPFGPRRRPRPPELDEDNFVFEERERHRGSRRHPREVDENLIFEKRERRGDRRHRPEPEREVETDLFLDESERRGHRRHRPERDREFESDPFIDGRERRRDRRHRPEPASEEDLLFEERVRERDSSRRRRSDPEFEEDDKPIVERERRRRSRRHPREFEEDGLVIEDKEIHRGSRRHPELRSEDNLLYEEREKRHRRRRPERELEEDLLVEGRGKYGGRRHHPERELEEEERVIGRKEREGPPLHSGWDRDHDFRSRERKLEFEEEEPSYRLRPRPPPPHRVEVGEVLLDNAPPERRRGPVDFLDREFEDDDVVIRRTNKGPRLVDRVDEEEMVTRGRERRRSVPSEDLERELRGLRREGREQFPLDEELSERSKFDSKSRSRDFEEIKEEVSIRKSKDQLPSRQPSPSLDSIHLPPIHQDMFTHHRHIDHGYKDTRTPRVRSPEPRSRRDSFDEVDIQHRKMRDGRMSEENLILKRRDSEESLAPEDSISPTSGPAVDFNDPWERETISATRRRPGPPVDESEFAYSHGTSDVSSTRDVEEDIMMGSTRIVNKTPGVTDDWSVVHPPSPDEPIEMTGALDVVEVKPRHASSDEAEMGRVAQKVTDPEEARSDRWTEIAKKLVVREAIEQMGFEYEETRTCYYIFSYLRSEDIDELIELSDEIRSARRRRIRDIQRERASVPDIVPRLRPRGGMPTRAQMIEKRMQDIRDREWMYSRRAPPLGSSLGLGRSPSVVRVNDENFNIPSKKRKDIICQLKKALLEQEVPSPLWAVLQVCDIQKIECIIQLAHFSLKIMDAICDLICTLPFKWTVTPSPSQQIETGCPPSNFSPRPRAPPVAIYAARERDGNKCVITGTRKIYQTAPIFPASAISSSLHDDPVSPNIWRFVDVFWGKETAERWKKAVFNKSTQPGSPVNDCTNLICLRRDLRSAWSSGLFALRPIWISDDMTEIEIEFYWQPRPDHKLYDMVDLAKEPISTKNLNSVDRLVVTVGKRDEPTYRVIESGYRFKMTTDDPAKRPLPSFDLLDMQWNFTRLIGLCAAGSFFDEDSEEDNHTKPDMTTQPERPSTPPNDDLMAWIDSSLSDFDSPPSSEFVEDINTSMIGPLMGPDANRSLSVGETSKSCEKLADADDSTSESSETTIVIDVISGTGHLSL
ncbi:hypothetical protein PITC_052170 [Penicillium italicum]|uniref:Uncharacterized protein n=1 Tax=Penicillium italicum TaxID=40296 RepID=A0A0A2KDW3_PENIT|nr:hypothetical protein PITC_052170 [Penicillium italicum]